jgi:hypothetical protein
VRKIRFEEGIGQNRTKISSSEFAIVPETRAPSDLVFSVRARRWRTVAPSLRDTSGIGSGMTASAWRYGESAPVS